ncbi:RNA polymerase I-specific transcription-initiation factor [Histoplasma ohiense]|nr:RNA polymerase I-specific transcription-initiation factor [Histoplasma ohiense (nom. inval.)]
MMSHIPETNVKRKWVTIEQTFYNTGTWALQLIYLIYKYGNFRARSIECLHSSFTAMSIVPLLLQSRRALGV